MKTHATLLLAILLPLAHSLSTASGADVIPTVVQSLDGPNWRLATDSTNVGRDEKWFAASRAEAVPTQEIGRAHV